MVRSPRAREERASHPLSRATWVPLLLIRVYLGLMFAQTGWGKVQDLDVMTERFAEWGIIWPRFNAALSSYTELIGGALLMVGLLTRLVSIPLAFNMAIATLVVKMKEVGGLGDFVTLDEPLYALIFLLFVFTGAGQASLDHLLARRHAHRATSERYGPRRAAPAGGWGARARHSH